jgi:hypothetical protein
MLIIRAALRARFTGLCVRGHKHARLRVVWTGRLACDFADQVESRTGLGVRVIGHVAPARFPATYPAHPRVHRRHREGLPHERRGRSGGLPGDRCASLPRRRHPASRPTRGRRFVCRSIPSLSPCRALLRTSSRGSFSARSSSARGASWVSRSSASLTSAARSPSSSGKPGRAGDSGDHPPARRLPSTSAHSSSGLHRTLVSPARPQDSPEGNPGSPRPIGK